MTQEAQKAPRRISVEQVAEWLTILSKFERSKELFYEFSPDKAFIQSAGRAEWSFEYQAWVVSEHKGESSRPPRIVPRFEDALYVLIEYGREWMRREAKLLAKRIAWLEEREAWCEGALDILEEPQAEVLYITERWGHRGGGVCVVGEMPEDMIRRALDDANKKALRDHTPLRHYFDSGLTTRVMLTEGDSKESE